MISLRSHAISLAAVFLALAVGVVLGSGLLSDTLLSGLREEKRDLQGQINALTDDKNALNERLGAANDFDTQVAPRIVRDALANKSVVVFRTPDANEHDLDALNRVIEQAGGTVTGGIELTQEFVDAHSAEKLKTVVNSSILPAGTQLSTTLVDQGSQAGDLLGITMLIDRDPKAPRVDDLQRQTVLAALRDTGFLAYSGDNVGAADTAVIVTGGPLGDDAGNQGATVARFAAALAGVAAAGFIGIAVALMGRNHPVGIVLAALLFGFLYQGGGELALWTSIPRELIVVIQALVILFTGALDNMVRMPLNRLFGAR